jgi:hypothetical protein
MFQMARVRPPAKWGRIPRDQAGGSTWAFDRKAPAADLGKMGFFAALTQRL